MHERAEVLRLLIIQRELLQQRETARLPTRNITANVPVATNIRTRHEVPPATNTRDGSQTRKKNESYPVFFWVATLIILFIAIHFNSGNEETTKSSESQDAKFSSKESSVRHYKFRTNFLDLDSASPFLTVSGDRQSAIRVSSKRPYSSHPSRFYSAPQVLTTNCVHFGSNYWLVDVQGYWDIGVAYPSIGRKGKGTSLGNNAVSWSLSHKMGNLAAYHNNNKITVQRLLENPDYQRIAVFVDFDIGLIHFAEVGNKLNNLYTFEAQLTRSVCLAVGLYSVDPPSSMSIINVSDIDFFGGVNQVTVKTNE
ncbi:E3 ubiquitin/ISG15 ligase TRIM25-like [Sardina pilchardus]|uniref:E3 ubiquitin/ISG15 ligase TRIM25-like n=1 Tax=Sardina pilchardus TaxID=27697 RepID=UPI002E0F52DB